MKTTTEILDTLNIADTTLQGLLRIWQTEKDPEKKSRTKDAITVIVEMHERNSFLSRFILKDFDTWNKVLTDEESSAAKAHNRTFYEPHLIEVLRVNSGKLDPIKAIAQVLRRVINDLTLADFTLTKSKRLRYDTTIRFCAQALKRRGVLSVSKEAKNKFWMLKTEEPTTLPDMG
jgi:hypothetical protein